MLEISVTFEEFQLVFNFMLFFHFNTIFFNSWKMQGSKNLGGCSLLQTPRFLQAWEMKIDQYPDTSRFFKETDCNAKITDKESKMTSITV